MANTRLRMAITFYLPDGGRVRYGELSAAMQRRGYSEDDVAAEVTAMEEAGLIQCAGASVCLTRLEDSSTAWPAGSVVGFRRLDPNAVVPAYAHDGDAGADLCAVEDVHLPASRWALVPTGIAVAIPDGYVGLIHPRSGLAAKLGVTVLNAPGTIDAGYRGEVKVNLINLSRSAVVLNRGDRIAQLLIQRVERARFRELDDLGDTARGTGGHGSTGTGAL